MPKFASHLLFAEEALARRPDLFPSPHIHALRLGAIGPDTTLFLFDPATRNPDLRKGFAQALEVLRLITDLKDQLERIADELTKPVDDIADWLTGGLSTDLKYTINAGLEALFLTAKLGVGLTAGTINIKNPIFSQLQGLPSDFIKNPQHLAQAWTINSVDTFGFPFRMFGHPFTDDGAWKQPVPPNDYSEWWWMDLLHYRRTGEFASRLLANASNSVQWSYARGYMTHVAGDVSGHPFINALVGGPFRNHAYRHLFLETLADTWLWDKQGRNDILGAQIDRQIQLNGGEAEEVARLVVRTMKEVYTGRQVPSLLKNGYPTEDEWLFAYRTMQFYLRLSTDGTVPRPKPPPDTPKEIIEEIKQLLGNNVPGSLPAWNGSLSDFLKSLFSWFSKGIALLIMIATLPYAVLVRFITIAPRWILYLVNLAIYHIISAIRTMLCLTGWGYCSNEDFRTFGFLGDWITTGSFEFGTYPMPTIPNPKPPFFWLIPPRWTGTPEREPTVPFSPVYGRRRPDWMMDPANSLDEMLVADFINASTPADTRSLERQFADRSVFGNAVDFSIALLEGRFDPVPDFDLDGDRGFGYRGWEVLPPGEKYV